jgi:aminoglycoside/choline kinase family phosphotransferase
MSEKLIKQLPSLLKTEDFELTPIEGGASTRKYFKILLKTSSCFPANELLLMTVPTKEIRTLTDYIYINQYFRSVGVSAPKILEIRKELGWLLLDYQEPPTLVEFLNEKPARTKKILPQLIETLIDMQQRCKPVPNCPAFQRFFDVEKYLFEFNFHVKEQLLEFYFDHSFSDDELIGFNQFSQKISETLDTKERVFVHRDFQSSNIFYRKDKKIAFKFIDFQDARSGSPIYDVVSCLWDSYITVDKNLKEDLLEHFFRNLKYLNISWDWDYFQKLVDYAIIQRKLHDAGAFAYNFRRTGNKKFTVYIPSALNAVTDVIGKYPEFSAIQNTFRQFEAVET